MSKFKALSGMKYKKENFRLLKDDIMSIEGIGGGKGPSFTLNENCEYVSRIKSQTRISKPTAEQRYLFNEILKYYELNSNQTIQGFNKNYFRDLTELMSKKDIKTNDYTKKRIELFNSRINSHHKSYIKYLKKEGKDTKMQSSMNKTINPMNVTFNLKLNNNIIMKKEKKPKNNSFIRLKNSLLEQMTKYFFDRYEKSASTIKLGEDFFLKKNLPKNRTLFKSASYLNKFNIENSESNLNHKLSLLNIKIKDDINKNNAEMELMEKKSKEEYFNTRNKNNYMKFLRSKYQFIEDNTPEKNESKLSIKDIKIFNMFKYRPKNLFLKIRNKAEDKKIFFRKIEKEVNKSNASELVFKPIRKKINKKQLSTSYSKFNILNNSVNQIYNKYFNKSD